MSRRCDVTGKGPMIGHNVSHANNKTKRRYLPNLQATSLISDALGRSVRLRISTRGLKTVERAGGLDAWLLDTSSRKLTPGLRKLRGQVEKARAHRAA